MPNYAQDDKWRFDLEWSEIKKRVDQLEKKVRQLEDYKKKQEEKQTQDYYRNKP
jgi:chromosome segregation ATPase